MVSFSSSVIKKGSKNFAPRAPSRRAAPPTPSHPSTSTQVLTGTVSQQTPQASQPSQASSQFTHLSQSTASSAQLSQQDGTTASNDTLSAHNVYTLAEEIPTPALSSTSITIPTTLDQAVPTPAASVPISKPISTPVATPRPAPIPVPAPTPIQVSASVPSAQAALSIPTPLPSSVQPSPSPASQSAPADEFPIERPAKRARISAPLQYGEEQIQTLTQTIPTPAAAPHTIISQPQRTLRAAASAQPGTDTTTVRATKAPAVRARRVTTANGEGRTGTPFRARRRRATTPDDAANMEVEPGLVKMSDLCKDPKTGKKSKREMELQKIDKQKREGNSERSINTEPTTSKSPSPPATATTDAAADLNQKKKSPPSSSIKLRVVNDTIVLDSDSLQIDRHAAAERDMEELEDVVESDLTRRINYASFGKRTKAESWDEELTNLFYRGLRMFGTDFMMISKMFPGRNRRQIKLKFCNEERKNPARIRETLLGPRESVTLEDYSEMTNTIYDDPAVIQKELDDERRRIEEEHAEEKRAREESLRNSGADRPLPSVEKGFRARLGAHRNAAIPTSAGHAGSEEILGTID
ncbi:Transcription factor TFIIIB component B [Ascosphaera aggregata]|nr:Transcription factor TFIIIB component B [Ascosphaera aggregata]